jgi:hypothetical protein
MEEPQVFVCAKSPVVDMAETVADAVPVLDTVTVCEPEVALTVVDAKVSEVGLAPSVAEPLPVTPVPDKATVVGLFVALLTTESEPVRTPLAVGWNVTLTVHEPPAATLVQLFVCA